MAEKKVAIIRFYDTSENCRGDSVNYAVYTTHSEVELQRAVNKIKKKFYDEDFVDWTFDDIMDELEEQGYIEELPEDMDVVWIDLCA